MNTEKCTYTTIRFTGILPIFLLMILMQGAAPWGYSPADTLSIYGIDTLSAKTGAFRDTAAIPNPVPDTSQERVSSPSIPGPVSLHNRDSVPDTTEILRTQLLRKESERRDIFSPHGSALSTGRSLHAGYFFNTDATSWYDLPGIKKRAIVTERGIASSYNRFLLYGNSAPITKIYQGKHLIFRRELSPFFGSDSYFPTEYGALCFEDQGSVHFHPLTADLISPETAIFWENGVFDENILTFRFSRPLTRRLTLNVFSNYRFFEGMDFDHNGNDVYSFYSKTASDTSLLSHEGYNPLVREYYAGADAHWKGSRAHTFFRIKYGDIANEIAIDRQTSSGRPVHALYSAYPLTITSGVSTRFDSPFFAIAEGEYISSSMHWKRPPATGEMPLPERGRTTVGDLTAAMCAGLRFLDRDTLSAKFTGNRTLFQIGDSLEIESFNYRPEVSLTHLFGTPVFSVNAGGGAGYDIHLSDADTMYEPFWHGSLGFSLPWCRFDCYAEKDNLFYPHHPDSFATSSIIRDGYLRAGAEIEGTWRKMSLLLGYQWCSDVDDRNIGRAWMAGVPPYLQPASVMIIAPEFGRWHGLSLASRLMLSDRRPFVKLQGELSMLVLPDLTHEAIDLRLGFDYWSERDTLVFAGISDWNVPILDVNFSVGVHIKTFRLFYKVDNLLNRDFSYIPGYSAPGLTFRWGFSWFIQR